MNSRLHIIFPAPVDKKATDETTQPGRERRAILPALGTEGSALANVATSRDTAALSDVLVKIFT